LQNDFLKKFLFSKYGTTGSYALFDTVL